MTKIGEEGYKVPLGSREGKWEKIIQSQQKTTGRTYHDFLSLKQQKTRGGEKKTCCPLDVRTWRGKN